jgi:DNA invertase Pin-like site-specific DNA recombinase
MNVSETMRRIEFLLEKHAPRDSLAFDIGDAIKAMPRDGRRRPITDAQKAEARRLRVAGYSFREIARAINSSDSVVYRALTGCRH